MLSGWTQEEVAAARAAILEAVRKGVSAPRLESVAKKQGVRLVGDYTDGFNAHGLGLRTHQAAKTKAIALESWAYGDVVPI
jgi:hypothetical protein